MELFIVNTRGEDERAGKHVKSLALPRLKSVSVTIRTLSPDDRQQWGALWDGYLKFYAHELSEDQTSLTWERLLHSDAGLNALVAEQEGELVGFAHYWWTPSTWIENQDLYLEDLFVKTDARGAGVARALFEELVEICKKNGGIKVHWQTHKNNSVARSLYDRLGKLSEFVVYEIKVD